MTANKRRRFSILKALHFFVRFLGLNGLIAIAVGLVLWRAFEQELAGVITIVAGVSAAAIALLVEVRSLAGAVVSHRGAAGTNVVVQFALAAALVIGGNYFSFLHYLRFDWTHQQTFTLDSTLRENLARLRGDTDIIIYLQHVSFGQRVELRQDEYDQAAEKVVARRVDDLAEQFGDLGPRFRVHLWDTQKKSAKDREQAIKVAFGWKRDGNPADNAAAEEKVRAIKAAPENSIFFYSSETKQLQRLGFDDILHPDKKRSREANNDQGNLVLIDQGVQSFEERVKIEEKKPRIGVAVAHPWLGLDGHEDYGMRALKNVLKTRGFESRDIVLKKYPGGEPAALEQEEGRFEELETQIAHLKEVIKDDEEELAAIRKARDFWQSKSLDDVNKEYVLARTQFGFRPMLRTQIEAFQKQTGRVPITAKVSEPFRQAWVKDLAEDIEFLEADLPQTRKRLAKAIDEQGKLNVENLAEQRRISDVRAKLSRVLANIDLLVVPRWTLRNVMIDDVINPRLYPLSDPQLEAIKDFMKAGKPVLFCLGPMNMPEEAPPITQADALEKMLEDFNIQLPNQTILFNSEADAMAEMNPRDQMRGAPVDIPPAELNWTIAPGSRLLAGGGGKAVSPIRSSMMLTARGLGENSMAGLKIRHPRPVYVARTTWEPDSVARAIGSLALGWPMGSSLALADLNGAMVKKFDESAVFLMTHAESWNEDKPFPTERWKPRFTRPKSDDPNKGTLLEKRRGPFPIGVALEAEVPATWYEGDSLQKPAKIRLAVIGQGGIFVGDQLPPMREKLFLDVANWLLGRDNLLAREGAPKREAGSEGTASHRVPASRDTMTWQYPRVKLASDEKQLWAWAMRAGLPFFFVCLGLNVWLVRRLR